ncbi:exopolysaccharide transport family protein [Microvirga arabica]|uniref:exopolysaccharide transport family protein n=1 Tax=Microvirga arabica TaxID=1128671 RepID=UPI0019394998|nr:exopolysaccharide transport family protein [Microvirga arabica]MBM1175250.1 hypothetical protein [Microvirga arabica]
MKHYRGETKTSILDEPQTVEPAADLSKIGRIIRRQLPFAVMGAVVAILIASCVLWLLEPSYRSRIQILLDQENTKLVAKISGEQQPADSNEYIATQLGLISSDIIARRVIYDLGLTYDNETARLATVAKEDSERVQLSHPMRVTSEDLVKANISPATISVLMNSISAYQLGRSLVIEIAVNDPDPQLAQQLASAYGRAYLTDQLSARFEAMRRAGIWLEDRINTLGEQSLKASAAVEKFRVDQNLISSNGRLVSDQQLGQLYEQLITVKSAVARAAARVQVFEDALSTSDVNKIISFVGMTSDALRNAPIRSLVDEYVAVTARARDVTLDWGDQNEQARALSAEGKRLSGLITDEAKRILDGYRGDFHVAQSEEKSIESAIAAAAGQSQSDMSTLVMLRNLEQRAASYNSLYQDYLARYQQAVQQQSLSLTSGRVISQPELPSIPVFPKEKLVFALALLLGAGAGGGLGFMRELLDRTIRTGLDIEEHGANFLGYIGKAQGTETTGQNRLGPASSSARIGTNNTKGDCWSSVLHRAKIALALSVNRQDKVVGVISLHPSHSRSLFALAFAESEAQAGYKVLLIERDAESSHLSATLKESGVPVVEIGSDYRKLDSASDSDQRRIVFIPASREECSEGAREPITAAQLKEWSSTFDRIIVDLPPAGPVSEARVLAPAFDGYICLAEWGKTSRRLLQRLLSFHAEFSKVAGVVITNVDMRKLHLFDPEAANDVRKARFTRGIF